MHALRLANVFFSLDRRKEFSYIKSRTLLCMFLVRRWPALPASAAPEKGSAGAALPPPHPTNCTLSKQI
jgi:hypothetical protein